MPGQPTDGYTPYLVEDAYVFTTDDGRTYSAVFEEQPFFSNDSYAFADQTYEFFLTLEKAPPAYTTDQKIGTTVAAIIRHFIEQDPLRLVCYSCDTVDGRHLARFKRFNEWFSLNNNDQYLKMENSLSSANRRFLFALIIRLDNPHSGAILVSFNAVSISLRSQK